MKNKKALTNPNPQSFIALLIFLITIALILYILFLPPADRAALLDQNRTYLDGNGNTIKDKITILMTKEPGRLSNIAEDEIIHDLPSFSLFTRTDATNIADGIDSFYVRKSLFEEQPWTVTFDVDDFENSENYMMSFTVPQRSGVLTISLNGLIIASKEFTTQSPQPIRLPKDQIKSTNTLEFSVSGPGIEFWKVNEYGVENFQIIADVTDRSSQDNVQMIFVSEEEKNNLESFDLKFVADCRTPDVGPVEIYLRKRIIYNSVPDCGSLTIVPTVDGDRLLDGENELLFRTDKGNYLFYSVEAKLKLREPIFPTYWFTIDSEKYDKIQDGDMDVNVSLVFTNSIDLKKGIILVNDYITEIATYDSSYSRNIDSLIREGSNSIEIRPKSEKLDITELNIVLAE